MIARRGSGGWLWTPCPYWQAHPLFPANRVSSGEWLNLLFSFVISSKAMEMNLMFSEGSSNLKMLQSQS